MYQLMIFGRPDARVGEILARLEVRLTDLGLAPNAIRVVSEADAAKRDPVLPTVALFCGYDGAEQASHPGLVPLLQDSIIIITIVSAIECAGRELPDNISHINALPVALPQRNIDRVASLVLESFRLLRAERRLFISYRRQDSQSVADQLYEALDARGYDVFIDTRAVPPAVDFQAELWHRLSDSDVVVLLDTEDFRGSRWTTEELARANATNIQILHLLWPGQAEDTASAFSFFYPLDDADFQAPKPFDKNAMLEAETIDAICNHAERLRARAIAARHRYLVDSFCDNARDRGFSPVLQPERWIEVNVAPGRTLAIVPAVGVPNSIGINRTFDAISKAGGGTGGIWMLYDSRGLLSSWLKHLDWLDSYLPVRAVRVASVDAELRTIAP